MLLKILYVYISIRLIKTIVEKQKHYIPNGHILPVHMSIHINNLTFSHDDSSLLQDLSFSIEKNQIGFVSGSSGIGKSTLFNIIAGLILPENGKIMLDDILLNDKHFSLETEKREIGYVFQDFALFPHINVKRNIKYAISSLNTSY